MSVMFYILLGLFLLLCVVLTFTISIQESKSSGFAAFMGSDRTDSVFGAATADVVKKFTGYLALFFLVGCLFLSIWSSSLGKTHSTYTLPPQALLPDEE